MVKMFIFMVADGTVKLAGGDQRLITSTLIRDRPDRGEEQGNLLGESDGSSTPFQDSSPDDGEARKSFLVRFRELHLPSTIVGTLMGTETCQIRGQVSQDSP